MAVTKKKPKISTIDEWFKEYSSFDTIFRDAELTPLFTKVEPIGENYLFIFEHLLNFYGSRPVIAPLTFDKEKDLHTIDKIRSIIQFRSRMLYYKYNMLSKTLLSNYDDYENNYKMTRSEDKEKTYGTGTIKSSGDDKTYQNQNIKTINNTSTDDSVAERFESSREVTTTPNSGDTVNSDKNSIKTVYGKTVTTTPSNENQENTITSSGYYNSGTKAKMIDQIRSTLNYDIIDMWVKDILLSFTYSFYMTEREIPEEFLL